VTPWARLVVQAVRAGGGTQPVSIGDGAWGIEVTGRDNGFSVRELGAFTDFVGPHVYRMENDVVRQHVTAAFVCELAAVAGKPVVLEEFGVTDAFVSREHAAQYYRQLLHSTLLAGATGWLAWNNTDFDDLADQDPYRHHAFEMRFGLTDADGNPKPQLEEVRAFADVLERIDLPACTRVEPDTALVVPSYLEHPYPFTEPPDRTHVFDVLRQAYVAAREADLPLDFQRELDGLTGGRRLYLVPSAKQLTAPAWRALAAFAEEGAVVYASYSPGSHGTQRGLWHADIDGMFGVEHQLRYGMVDPIADDHVTVTFERDFGSIGAGAPLRFTTGGNEHTRAYLPVRPAGAEVIARDQHGNPVLLARSTGAGLLVLCTYPLEAMAAALPGVNPEQTHEIYRALAVVARVRRDVTVVDPLVHVGELRHRDGDRFVWLVSQSPTEHTVTPVTGAKLTDLHTDRPVDEVTLAPFDVRVLRSSE
jgi:endo-1,4-beta-mannosidase